jgi:hypothetical protein
MIFNVGARRSGTFWLQRIVGAHPDVAAIATESHLFSHGVAPLFERFHHGARSSPQLGALHVDRGVLLDAARDFCDRVFSELSEPGARFLAERTPLHVYHLELMGAIYPDASFVHIIRDGRDVARSLVKQPWGPKTIAEAAEEWRSSVAAGRAARPPRLLEIRYEDLLERPRESARDLYEWLGLALDEATLDRALDEAKTSANLDPSDRRIQTAKWRSALSVAELQELERVAGPLLAELGYAEAGSAGRFLTRAPGESSPRNRSAIRPRLASARAMPRRARGLLNQGLPRARRRLRGGSPPPSARPDHPIHEGHAAFDQLLGHLHSGQPADVAEMLEERASVSIVDRGKPRGGRGRAGRDVLLEELRSDRAFSGRQVRGDVHSGMPVFTAVLEYELEDGSREGRVIVARLPAGRVESLALYRL